MSITTLCNVSLWGSPVGTGGWDPELDVSFSGDTVDRMLPEFRTYLKR